MLDSGTNLGQAAASSILALARALGLKPVAELLLALGWDGLFGRGGGFQLGKHWWEGAQKTCLYSLEGVWGRLQPAYPPPYPAALFLPYLLFLFQSLQPQAGLAGSFHHFCLARPGWGHCCC